MRIAGGTGVFDFLILTPCMLWLKQPVFYFILCYMDVTTVLEKDQLQFKL